MKAQNYIILLLLLTGTLLEVWKIGQQPVEQWDEARRGINAVSMMKSGDYFNYHFLDKPDTFNTKPPLTVWLIILNFELFGVSDFALRFHSMLATVFFFFFISRLILLYKDRMFLILFLCIIITVNGIIGFHVGRTGDTDSLLVLFLTGFLYYFLRYWDFGRSNAIIWAAIFLGLAFYAKSVAIFLMLPAVFGYMLMYPDKHKILNKKFFLAAGIFLIMIGGLGFLPAILNSSVNDSSSLFRNIFSVDLFRRFADNSFEAGYDPFYIFHVLDMNFSVWNYILYSGGIYGIYRLIKSDKPGQLKENKLFLLSLLISLSYAILLTASMNKHRWYIAPAIPFFAIMTVQFLIQFKEKPWFKIAFFLLAGILTGLKFHNYNNPDTHVHNFYKEHKIDISRAEKVYVHRAVPQHLIWELVKYNYKNARISEGLPSDAQSYVYFGPLIKKENSKVTDSLQNHRLVIKKN